MEQNVVSFPVSVIVGAVVLGVFFLAGTLIWAWMGTVQKRFDAVEKEVTALKVSTVTHVDLQRLEDKMDVRHEKQDAKLDKIVSLLMRIPGAER
jgi:uncharacterized membrane protein (DUF106 family)